MLYARIPERGGGTDGREPERAERNPGCRAASAGHRVILLRRAQHSVNGDENTPAHNTLSAESTRVQVFYPFHPLHGAALQILRRPKRGDGAVSVIDPAGRRLKIPVWMLLPECAGIRMSRRPHLGKEALLSLASLIASQLAANDRVHDNPSANAR